MNLTRKLTLAFAMLWFTGTAHATAIIVDFPSGDSITTASAGQFFFTPAHTVNETFSGTGINALTSLDLALDINPNSLDPSAFVDFDVLVNSMLVGAFTIDFGDDFRNLNFSFAEIFGAGTYNIELAVTNTVPPGFGSIGFSEVNSTATLTGDEGNQVPVPAPGTLLLLGLGLFGLGLTRRVRSG